MESDILDKASGSLFSHAADGRENAGANRPVAGANFRIFAEIDLYAERFQSASDPFDSCKELFTGFADDLGKNRSEVGEGRVEMGVMDGGK